MTERREPPPPASDPTADNVRLVAEMERRLARQRTWSERVSDRITAVAGSLLFVAAHVVAITCWAVWNATAPQALRFDPYPYGLITFIVSLEGVLIATFVLITQNRMAVQNDHRDRLNLEVDMLAEQEMTLVLRMLARIAERVGVPLEDHDAAQMASFVRPTDVDALAQRLEAELPPAAGGVPAETPADDRPSRDE